MMGYLKFHCYCHPFGLVSLLYLVKAKVDVIATVIASFLIISVKIINDWLPKLSLLLSCFWSCLAIVLVESRSGCYSYIASFLIIDYK